MHRKKAQIQKVLKSKDLKTKILFPISNLLIGFLIIKKEKIHNAKMSKAKTPKAKTLKAKKSKIKILVWAF